jgi:hypothetical protein
MTYRKNIHTETDMEDQSEELFRTYWQRDGIRQLNPDNTLPNLEERCRAAFLAGLNATQRDDNHF